MHNHKLPFPFKCLIKMDSNSNQTVSGCNRREGSYAVKYIYHWPQMFQMQPVKRFIIMQNLFLPNPLNHQQRFGATPIDPIAKVSTKAYVI